MRLVVLLAVCLSVFSTTYSAPALAKCGEKGEKACLGLTCKKGLRKNDNGICKPCGANGQRACIGNPCPGRDVIYRAGYCTTKNIACGVEGQPPCHILKGGTPCREGLGVFGGKCGSCGGDFERACPRAERGNNCESHLKFSKGVCVPRANPEDTGPATYVYNASAEAVHVTWWPADGGVKTLQPGKRAKISVPELHCLDQTNAGLVNADNETYLNVPYLVEVKNANCAQWTNVDIWTSAQAKRNAADYRLPFIPPDIHNTHLQNRKIHMATRFEQLAPGSAAYRKGMRARVRAPETHAWVIYWGDGLIEAGRLGDVSPSLINLGLTHPDQRSDGRLRRLYGQFAEQWAMCRPDAPTGCQSEELLDYSVNGVGSVWEFGSGKHMVEFKFMDDTKLIAKRLGLNETRHYRHHNKVSNNKYTNRHGNHYVFTSSHTGYFQNGKTGKKTRIRRTRALFDPKGLYHVSLKGKPVTFVISQNPIPSLTKPPSWIKVKRADDFRKTKYDRVETAINLYKAEDGSTLRFRESLTRKHMEALSTSHKGYSRTYKRMELYASKDALEGEWKAGGDEFSIGKQKKDSLVVRGLNGQGKQKFERVYDNALLFKRGKDRIGVTHSGFWLQLRGESRKPIRRRR
ncbi:MAG: hypothetical protein AB8B93_10370 [Pseudomonadales bacterium]